MSELYGVLWDLDNTLLPSKEVTAEIVSEIFPEFDCQPPSVEQIHDVFGIHLEEMLAHLSDNHPEQGQIIDRFVEEQAKRYKDEIILFEGALESVARLGEMGVRQGIVTTRGNKNRGPAGAAKIIKKSGLKKYAQVVVTSDDIKLAKPHPAPLYFAMAKLGIEAKNTIMVGDQKNDIEAAKRAGALSVGLVHDNFPEAYRIGEALLEAGATAIRYRPESVVSYAQSVFKLK